MRTQSTGSHEYNYAAHCSVMRKRAEGCNVKLNEQTGNEKGGKRNPRPCRNGFGVATAQQHCSDGRFDPNESLPVVKACRRYSKANQNYDGGQKGNGSGARAGQNKQKCYPGDQGEQCEGGEGGRGGWV